MQRFLTDFFFCMILDAPIYLKGYFRAVGRIILSDTVENQMRSYYFFIEIFPSLLEGK